jgi:hypothetical protein
MCDYSLENVTNRPATIGDKLMTTAFFNSITRGFAAVGQPNVAVCLRPGTEIAFDKEVEYEPLLPFMRNRKTGATLARFRQLDIPMPGHRDALEFPNGKIVLLTKLAKGQRATVLQLPASARTRASEQTAAPVTLDLTPVTGGQATELQKADLMRQRFTPRCP